MKTFIKTMKTLIGLLAIIAGLTALVTINTANNLNQLLLWGFVIIMGLGVGCTTLINTFPSYFKEDDYSKEEKDIIRGYIEKNINLINNKTELIIIIEELIQVLKEKKIEIPYELRNRIENQSVRLEDIE